MCDIVCIILWITSLNVKPVNRYKVKPNEQKEFRDVDFGTNLENLQAKYLDLKFVLWYLKYTRMWT